MLQKAVLVGAITIAFGSGSGMAAQVPGYNAIYGAVEGNLSMLTPDGTGEIGTDPVSGNPIYGGNGATFGGTNDVTFSWDGTIYTSSSDYTGPGGASNAALSSPTKFYGALWTAHTVQIFGPGTYSFDTTAGGGPFEAGTQTMTVGPGQLGMHMLLDWYGTTNIDIVNVWNVNSTFSNCGVSTADMTAQNCLWTGRTNNGGNSASTLWFLASTDNDGDGTLGIPMMPGGPLAGFNANFNIKAVPLPAAGWLFISGLLGLAGLSRRRAVH